MSTDDRTTITPRELAEELSVHRSTIYRRIRTGAIEHVKVAGRILIRKADLYKDLADPGPAN